MILENREKETRAQRERDWSRTGGIIICKYRRLKESHYCPNETKHAKRKTVPKECVNSMRKETKNYLHKDNKTKIPNWFQIIKVTFLWWRKT